MASGAEVIYPLEDQFYGERGGRLRDPSGQQPAASAVLATAYLPELVTPLTAPEPGPGD